jgi:predicted metal-binding protein
VKVHVCTSCGPDDGFLAAVRAALPGAEVAGVDCMSGCTRPRTVAFRAQGKVAYLFGDLRATDIDELRNFHRLYAASPDGTFADARVLGALRTKAIARIPA